ncbi:2-dehydro-3-deoxygluconokinase [Alkalihalophilus pseudofirmus]|uniref:sugar kinase n=1 Tax=Alkalihalobacterium alkalinitrilicum TaxID=427920 RepID=UPI00094DB742|nr:sugar kinase [Alkalihalobacterium alkalinitrilicum]OLO39355.1 2-dehydro-3-deoxygluconokinase [Alkalihalophilus pseudofirmus]
MKKLDVVTFGETMVLFQPEQMQPLEYVYEFPKRIGGAESNVAIGLSRLGHTVGWFSKLGDDPFGRYILKSIRGEGVETSSCLFTKEAPTGLIFKERLSPEDVNVYYYRKGSAASLLETTDLDEEYIANAKILHLTGITPALSDTCYQAVMKSIEIAKKNKMKIVFDPNLRLKLWSLEKAKQVLNEIASHSDVILPGLDEGQFMTGKTEIEEVAEALMGGEDKTIIMKLGSKGAYLHTKDEQETIEGYPVTQIVDPVGAGDGFAAGILSGLLREEPLPIVVKRANAIGAMVVGMTGDIEGLPTLAAVEQFMQPNTGARDVNR